MTLQKTVELLLLKFCFASAHFREFCRQRGQVLQGAVMNHYDQTANHIIVCPLNPSLGGKKAIIQLDEAIRRWLKELPSFWKLHTNGDEGAIITASRIEMYWFNPCHRHIVVSLHKTPCDTYLCLVALKQAANYLDKTSSNNRKTWKLDNF